MSTGITWFIAKKNTLMQSCQLSELNFWGTNIRMKYHTTHCGWQSHSRRNPYLNLEETNMLLLHYMTRCEKLHSCMFVKLQTWILRSEYSIMRSHESLWLANTFMTNCRISFREIKFVRDVRLFANIRLWDRTTRYDWRTQSWRIS